VYASISANIGLGSNRVRFLRRTGLAFVIETKYFQGEFTTIRPTAWFVVPETCRTRTICPLAASSGSHLTETPALSLDVGVHNRRQPFNSHANKEKRGAE
jgi:hypothetical protein